MKIHKTASVKVMVTSVSQEKAGAVPTVTMKPKSCLVALPEGGNGWMSETSAALVQTQSVLKELEATGATLGESVKVYLMAYQDDGSVAFNWSFNCTSGEMLNEGILHDHLIPAAHESWINAKLNYQNAKV